MPGIDHSNVKVPLLGHEVEQMMDSLSRVRLAIQPTATVMFLGGPHPSDVLSAIEGLLQGKLKDAISGVGGITMPSGDRSKQ